MLNALCVSIPGANKQGEARAAICMQHQGFRTESNLVRDGVALTTWSHPCQHDSEAAAVDSESGTARCVGPLWYRGQFGAAGLRLLLADVVATAQFAEAALFGNFAVFVQTSERSLLFNDLLGLVRIHASPDGAFYSTSWLATVAYAGRVEVDSQAAMEYVLLGAAHSEHTAARGVRKLPLASAFDLTTRSVLARPRIWFDVAGRAPTLEAAVATISSHLRTTFRQVATAFPRRTRMALSGGFDSRLILAGLLDAGARPDLFVYGDPSSTDVLVAQDVANQAGLPLETIDKPALDQGHAPLELAQLVDNALFFDGLPNDGIWDIGSDRTTRLAQTSGGRLVLNGGGGEIFRNYFHLPDRRFSALDIVRTFYRAFDRYVFRRPRDLADYESHMAAAIMRAIDARDENPRRPLDRRYLELAYPLFRCHHWMAINNSVGARHGHYVTPLIDPVGAGLAWRLPLAWKNAGRLESRLIHALDVRAASAMSEYGFRFGDGPGIRARVKAWGSRARPVFARPFIGMIGRRWRKDAVSTALTSHCRALLPGEWCMDHLLDLDRLPSDSAFARALAIEVVWRRLLP